MEELLQKVITKVYQLNRKMEHDFFFDFSGHTNTIDVYYYKGGWDKEKEIIPIIETTTTLTENNLQKTLKKLEKIEKEG